MYNTANLRPVCYRQLLQASPMRAGYHCGSCRRRFRHSHWHRGRLRRRGRPCTGNAAWLAWILFPPQSHSQRPLSCRFGLSIPAGAMLGAAAGEALLLLCALCSLRFLFGSAFVESEASSWAPRRVALPGAPAASASTSTERLGSS